MEQFVPQELHSEERIHRGAEEYEKWKRQPHKLTTAPMPMFPSFSGEEVEKIRSEVEPGKKGGAGRWGFEVWFYFSYPTLFLLVINYFFH